MLGLSNGFILILNSLDLSSMFRFRVFDPCKNLTAHQETHRTKKEYGWAQSEVRKRSNRENTGIGIVGKCLDGLTIGLKVARRNSFLDGWVCHLSQ